MVSTSGAAAASSTERPRRGAAHIPSSAPHASKHGPLFSLRTAGVSVRPVTVRTKSTPGPGEDARAEHSPNWVPTPPRPSLASPPVLTEEVDVHLTPTTLLNTQPGLQGQHCGQRGFSCFFDALPQKRHLRRLFQAALGQRHPQCPRQGVVVPQEPVPTANAAHHLTTMQLRKGLAQEEP
ncbi:hypothetical protein I79_018171 [Cricetulus griseus]|uniref:Uncharacterized protein n=1 Tax=Cricetulus griseus TaxID=10029 RepID=G3I400_CRIGR|nr:hypothetical protein I79_018171 [Cricetulus griseus]ERE80990.1 hypothetical protein H671_3g8421 [Cricetulus griseus]